VAHHGEEVLRLHDAKGHEFGLSSLPVEVMRAPAYSVVHHVLHFDPSSQRVTEAEARVHDAFPPHVPRVPHAVKVRGASPRVVPHEETPDDPAFLLRGAG